MDSQDLQADAFQLLKSFFLERRNTRAALGKLRESVEIEIVIGGMVRAAIFRRGTEIFVEKREALNPDFVFRIEPQTVSILAHQTPDEIAEIGLAIIKEMLAGSIRVEMRGGLISVLRNGYLELIASGGAPVMKLLTQIGLGSPTKIVELFRKIRR